MSSDEFTAMYLLCIKIELKFGECPSEVCALTNSSSAVYDGVDDYDGSLESQ